MPLLFLNVGILWEAVAVADVARISELPFLSGNVRSASKGTPGGIGPLSPLPGCGSRQPERSRSRCGALTAHSALFCGGSLPITSEIAAASTPRCRLGYRDLGLLDAGFCGLVCVVPICWHWGS